MEIPARTIRNIDTGEFGVTQFPESVPGAIAVSDRIPLRVESGQRVVVE